MSTRERIFLIYIFHLLTQIHVVCCSHTFNACSTPNARLGQCIFIKQCEVLYTLLMKIPLTEFDEAYLRRSQCGQRNGHPLVCCPLISIENSTSYAERFEYGGSRLPSPSECGANSYTGKPVVVGLIVGGEITKIYEAPWMAMLQYLKPGGTHGFHCGGVIINPRYILTASHCVNGKDLRSMNWKLVSVRLGEWDTTRNPDCENGICADLVSDIAVEYSIPHPNYRPFSRTQKNDIALLRLIKGVTFTDWIRPICLPVEPRLRNANYDGIGLQTLGWGYTSSDKNAIQSNIKLKVTLNVVPRAECNNIYSAFKIQLGSSQLCAGGDRGFDSCKGDSGGPLMRYDTQSNPPKWYLVGIVSFGPAQCGLANWPGIYTRVDHFVDWIISQIKN